MAHRTLPTPTVRPLPYPHPRRATSYMDRPPFHPAELGAHCEPNHRNGYPSVDLWHHCLPRILSQTVRAIGGSDTCLGLFVLSHHGLPRLGSKGARTC